MTERYNPRATLATTSGAALVSLIGVPAALLLAIDVPKDEGIVLKGYRDPAGIATKCMGDTYDVTVGKRYTMAECTESTAKQLLAHAAPVMKCAPSLRHAAPEAIYASVSYAYNAGPGRFCRDWRNRKGVVIHRAAGPLFEAGKWRDGCLALGRPTTAGGKVYPGLVKRRKKEVAACLEGLS